MLNHTKNKLWMDCLVLGKRVEDTLEVPYIGKFGSPYCSYGDYDLSIHFLSFFLILTYLTKVCQYLVKNDKMSSFCNLEC